MSTSEEPYTKYIHDTFLECNIQFRAGNSFNYISWNLSIYKLKHEKADILIVILQPTREASSRCANT